MQRKNAESHKLKLNEIQSLNAELHKEIETKNYRTNFRNESSGEEEGGWKCTVEYIFIEQSFLRTLSNLYLYCKERISNTSICRMYCAEKHFKQLIRVHVSL